jgi:hypothetical protein
MPDLPVQQASTVIKQASPSSKCCHAEAAGRSIFRAEEVDRVKAKCVQPTGARVQMLRCAQHDKAKGDLA